MQLFVECKKILQELEVHGHLDPLKFGKSKVAPNPSLKDIAIIYGMVRVSFSNTLTCLSRKLHNGNFGEIIFS